MDGKQYELLLVEWKETSKNKIRTMKEQAKKQCKNV
jgi:hypothetical protein